MKKPPLSHMYPRKIKPFWQFKLCIGKVRLMPTLGTKKKPVIITTYNETKYGVDILDKMCVQYDTARNSRRWPLTIFFHLLNVGGVNAMNIYRANHNNVNIVRSDYLTELAFLLMKPAIERRITVPSIPKEISTRGKLFLKLSGDIEQPQQQPRGNARKGRCFICPGSRDKTSRKTCENCKNWFCPYHQKTVCERCHD